MTNILYGMYIYAYNIYYVKYERITQTLTLKIEEKGFTRNPFSLTISIIY